MKDVNGPRAFLFLQVEQPPSGYGTSTYSCRVKAVGILGSLSYVPNKNWSNQVTS